MPRLISSALPIFALLGCSSAGGTEGSSTGGPVGTTSGSGVTGGPTLSASAGSSTAETTVATTATQTETSNADTAAGSSSTGGFALPQYNPLFASSFEDMNVGQPYGWTDSTTGGVTVYDDARARGGTQSLRLEFMHMDHGLGGASDLVEPVELGETVWFSAHFYFPSDLSLSHGDVGGDGFGYGKFMVISPAGHAPPRTYLEIASPYQVDAGEPDFADTNVVVLSDHEDLNCRDLDDSPLPRDEWFALQMAFHVNTDGGWVRAWLNDRFLGQCDGNVGSGDTQQSWGIGDYWNGGAWVSGGSTNALWMDEVIITKEPPDALDDGGRPFIAPLTRVDDFG